MSGDRSIEVIILKKHPYLSGGDSKHARSFFDWNQHVLLLQYIALQSSRLDKRKESDTD